MAYDVAVIGTGPAGLSATVYSAAEGLSVIALGDLLGGQAGTSSKIENYLGFPRGISGPALTRRSVAQAEKFGAEVVQAKVKEVRRHSNLFEITYTSDTGRKTVYSKALIIATGAHYMRLDAATDYRRFENKGIHYAATSHEARGISKEVIVIGGGNSAGQAAQFLSTHAKVHVLLRSGELSDTMSFYLTDRLVNNPNVQIHRHTEVEKFLGKDRLTGVVIRNNETNEKVFIDTNAVFVMIGARPQCDFLRGMDDVMDPKGFIVADDNTKATSIPGLYAVGDCRSGSVKRVANAVGEGSTAVPQAWNYVRKEAA